ncbi:MAG: hypothetical protein ACYTG0_43740 [Planctomycetota bacterium]
MHDQWNAPGVGGSKQTDIRPGYSQNYIDNRSFVWWTEFCDEMKAAKPDCLLIGEIWSNPQVMASYLQTGMDSVYDFSLSQAIRESVRTSKDRGVVNAVLEMNRLWYPFTVPEELILVEQG